MTKERNNEFSKSQTNLRQDTLTSLPIESDVMKWYDSKGEHFFRSVGLYPGNIVLDFGCRVGNYAIPAAKVVGKTGKVYALDKNHSAIDELMHRAQVMSIDEIIVPIKTDGELEIDLDDGSVDFILFYDVIRNVFRIDESLSPYRCLLGEFERILKKDGVLSLFIKHLHDESLTPQDVLKTTKSFFDIDESQVLDLMHWNNLEEGTIHNLRKT
ncbi:MAG: methyltransferase domain-containing protein [Candidatus Thorarchaeota archaeon]